MLSSQSHMSVSVVYVLCVFILCPFFSLPSVSLSVRRWGFSFPTQSPRNPLHLLFIVCWLVVVVVGVTVLCLLDVVLTINSYTLQLHTERTQSDYLAMISLFCSVLAFVSFVFCFFLLWNFVQLVFHASIFVHEFTMAFGQWSFIVLSRSILKRTRHSIN